MIRHTKTLLIVAVICLTCCNKPPVPPPAVTEDGTQTEQKPSIDVNEPEFQDSLYVLPEHLAEEIYSPSELAKAYYPVNVQYKPTVSSKSWTTVKTRIVPYLVGFEDYEMTREEYVSKTNRYGSSTELPQQEATGRFYVKKIGDRFWLVDPYGYVHYHRGVAVLRPGSSSRQAAAFNEKYGGNRVTWLSEVQEELASIGFHGSGAFGSGAYEDVIAHNQRNLEKPITLCPSFGFLAAFKSRYKLTNVNGDSNTAICNVLDERWPQFCEEYIREDLKMFLNDPNVVGIFSDNEIDFSSQGTMLLNRILGSENTSHAAYVAAKEFMDSKGKTVVTSELNDEFVGQLAEIYYKGVKEALLKVDPHMLYLGSRLHGTPKIMPGVVKAAGKWCDVISVNYYGKWSVQPEEHVSKWAEWAPDTPFMITEFYTKACDTDLHNGHGAGLVVPTQKERAFAYQHFTLGLLEAKNCVGWHWFKYLDDDGTDNSSQPANKGLYDNSYTIYPWLAKYSKDLNYNVYRLIEYFDN